MPPKHTFSYDCYLESPIISHPRGKVKDSGLYVYVCLKKDIIKTKILLDRKEGTNSSIVQTSHPDLLLNFNIKRE